ncbi:MAG: glycoside hydrolase family 76 protein, partial [Polyangiaceae bacterium]
MPRWFLSTIACFTLSLGAAACSSGSPTSTGAAGASSGPGGSAGSSSAVGGALPGAAGGAGQTTGGVGGAGQTTGGANSGAGGANGGAAGSAISVAGASGAAPTPPGFPPLIPGCAVGAAHEHADSALGATLSNFWSGADQYLRAVAPSSDGKLTGYWTFAQVFDAVLDGVERSEGQRFQGLIRSFYEGRAARGWLVDYYDDEAWMTLALMRAYDLTGEQRYLDTAESTYQDIMTQWDTTCCGTHLGGIWWD